MPHGMDPHVLEAFRADTRRVLSRRVPGGIAFFVALVIGPTEEFLRDWLGRRDEKELAQARRVLPEAAWEAVRGGVR